MSARYFGARVHRVEDPKLVQGGGRYVDDIKLSNIAHAAFLRSPLAHARIRSIDKDAARAMPGVIAVLTVDDLGPAAAKPTPCTAPAPAIKQMKTPWPLARGAVHYVGETVAMVVAETRHQAEDAANLVLVEYDELPALNDWRDALKPDAIKVHEDAENNIVANLKGGFGDCDSVFASAAHVFKETLTLHRGGCHSMECRGVLARVDEVDGRLDVWSSTQTPYTLRRVLAQYLGRDERTVRVEAPDVGGGFGPKAPTYPEEYAVALAAMKLSRPVKWIEDRREHFLATNQQRDQVWDVEVAADAEGRMLAVRGTCLHDHGAYVPMGIAVPMNSLASFPGPYALKAMDLKLDAVFTNKVPVTPVRGAGRPNCCFVLERLADRIAKELGIEPEVVRRKSLVKAEQMPYPTGVVGRDGKTQITYDSGDFNACLDMAVKPFADFRQRQAAARKEGRYLGLGIASYVEDTGLGPYEGCTVRIHTSGKVSVYSGAAAQGQGLKTILAQIVADELGVAIEDVTVETADTARFPIGMGTVGSRVAITGGASAHLAASELRDIVLKTAGELLQSGNKFLKIENGVISIEGEPDKKVKIGQIAQRHQNSFGAPQPDGMVPDLAVTRYFEVKRLTYANGANACEIEVDPDTGAVKLLRYVVGHDCGRIIHPGMVDGQIRGGVVHGISNALFEHMKFDDNATPVTTNYGEFLLPIATELPRIEIHHMETPSPLNPIGVKGVGEGGTIPATACVIAAIEDALAPFGVKIAEHPLSPSRIVELIAEARHNEAA
ncbi:MAG: hypothetical protein RLZ98_1447 [Pseudomonadota bacterium]|jgi:carbon-monoxide dehydrogenase large subunit